MGPWPGFKRNVIKRPWPGFKRNVKKSVVKRKRPTSVLKKPENAAKQRKLSETTESTSFDRNVFERDERPASSCVKRNVISSVVKRKKMLKWLAIIVGVNISKRNMHERPRILISLMDLATV